MARSFIQLRNTAHIAPHICSIGSLGKSEPVCSFMAFLNSATSFCSDSTDRSLSSSTPCSFFTSSIIFSNGSMSSLLTGFMPSTTSPYICTKRRYESYTKCGLPVFFAMPAATSSLRPRLRMVSIMPGIEARAPERTDTSSGLLVSPNLQPIRFSTCVTAAFTSSCSSSTILSWPTS